MSTYLPLFLDTHKLPDILVIGGGEIATAKTEALASTGAAVEVVARQLSDGLRAFCKQHQFAYHETDYDVALLAGRKIVIAATDDDEVNQQIAQDCRDRAIMVNVVDNPSLCDFIFPALIRRGNVQIAVSTSGVAPVLARMIKQQIEQLLPARLESLVSFLEQKKQTMRQVLTRIQPRRMFSESVINGSIAQEVLEGNHERAEKLFNEALHRFPDEHNAALYLIGAGPGNPDLLTVKAIRLLGRADVIMYDRLVSPDIITQYARKDAEKIPVGKTRLHHYRTQEEIDALIAVYLQEGKIVARLKGGDPGIYAHGAEEIAIARRVGAPYQIVPGVTAANGCAAYAGIPLTERGGALSVRFLTVYSEQLHDEDFWRGLSYATGETLVFYMSSHKFGLLCERLIASGFAPSTPFMAIEQGTTDCHRDYVGTLDTFETLYADHRFASPCLMIVGDVVRWRETHQWKQPATPGGSYFPELPKQEVA